MQQGKAEPLVDVVSVHRGPLQPSGHQCHFERNKSFEFIDRDPAVPVEIGLARRKCLEDLMSEETILKFRRFIGR